MRARKALRWVFIALYAVLWIGGVVNRCMLKTTAPTWAAPLFLLSAAVIVALSSAETLPLIIFAAGGFLVELLGVHTGFPFGRYSYSAELGVSSGGVPLAISCAWLTLLVWARDLASRFSAQQSIGIVCGAVIMTASDLLIDPVATRTLGYWRWNQPGIFFGVPLINFLGWFAVSAVLLKTAGRPACRSNIILVTGFTMLAFFGVIAAFG